jgi:hypothetical protein
MTEMLNLRKLEHQIVINIGNNASQWEIESLT